MAEHSLKFDDVLEPSRVIEIGGMEYGLPPDVPSEIIVLQAKMEIEQVKAQADLDALARREIDDNDVEAVRSAIDQADEITRRMTELEDRAKAKVLEFFNDPEHRRGEVAELPLPLSQFFSKLIPYLYGDANLESLLPAAREGSADPTQANARRVRAQAKAGGTKSTSTSRAKKKASSSSTS